MVCLLIAEALLLQARADARAEQHRVEGLRQVVLRAELDAPHHAVHLVERRDHQDGQLPQRRVALELPEHLVAVDAGHHDVEQDQVDGRRRVTPEGLERGLPVGGRVHREAFTDEATGQEIAITLVVVDNQDDPSGCLVRGGGARPVAPGTRRCPRVPGAEKLRQTVRGLRDAREVRKQLSGAEHLGTPRE